VSPVVPVKGEENHEYYGGVYPAIPMMKMHGADDVEDKHPESDGEEDHREDGPGLIAAEQEELLVGGGEVVGYFGLLVALDVLQHGRVAGEGAGGEEGVGAGQDEVLAR
jgi:hypothetical protein